MFAGEVTNNRYFKLVHGAIESGWREANKFVRDLRSVTEEVLPSKPKECSVVIVGAGMAGLGAARELLAGGITDIVILEAQKRAGGRVCSVPQSEDGMWIELGAQWIHGEDNPIHRFAQKRGLLSGTTSAEALGPYLQIDGSEICSSMVAHVSHKICEILEDCEKFVDQKDDFPLSVGDYMFERFEEYMASCTDDTKEESRIKWELFHWHRRFQEIDNSCSDLNALSAKDWGKYKFTGGEDCINLLSGYSSVVNAFVQDLPENILFLNSPVTKVFWGNQVFKNGLTTHDSNSVHPVTVVCGDKSCIQTDHIIVTSSMGFLKEYHKTLFEPSLPSSLCTVIEAIGFGVVDKVFLLYDEPWWDEKSLAFQVVQPVLENEDKVERKEEPESWLDDLTGFDVLSRDPAILLAWIGGDGAAHMERLCDDDVAQHCTDMLRKCTKRIDIPLPSSIVRSCWLSNPYIRGGYSHTTVACDKLGCGPKDLAQPVFTSVPEHPKHPAILLAGEAAHEFHFSTTHGAFESGQNQARIIVDYWKDRKMKSCKASFK